MGVFDQDGFKVRFDWGEAGLRTLAPSVDVLVIVDVLSFSTCVDVATSRGAGVYPYAVRDQRAEAFAAERGAMLAANRRQGSAEQPYSLSPCSLANIPRGTRLVLPSPNGSTLTTVAAQTHLTVAGCLRNARAVAAWAEPHGCIGVIAAGELRPDGTLRFAVEDLVGAGAILRFFPPEVRSPEAEVAVAAFGRFANQLHTKLAESASGRELAAIGFKDDVAMAAELDVSQTVPLFVEAGLYMAAP